MTLDSQITICSENYQRWKEQAFFAKDIYEARKALERAFFWLELQSAFITLHAIEQIQGKDPEIKKKLIIAKTNLSKKLADYANEIMKEIG